MLDEETKLMPSPTGKYAIKATVNRTDNSKPDAGKVIIHVYADNRKLFDFNSTASDIQKWALGWTVQGDTILLQTSDIGDRAWTIIENGVSEITMTDALNSRCDDLKREKYK
jgi:hypothetical protein